MIYLAAPYSDKDHNIIQGRMEQIYGVLGSYIRQGFLITTPLFMHEVVMRNPDMPNDYQFWENYCLNLLKRCDSMIVLRLAGWEESRGVKGEIEFCAANNIPVEYI